MEAVPDAEKSLHPPEQHVAPGLEAWAAPPPAGDSTAATLGGRSVARGSASSREGSSRPVVPPPLPPAKEPLSAPPLESPGTPQGLGPT